MLPTASNCFTHLLSPFHILPHLLGTTYLNPTSAGPPWPPKTAEKSTWPTARPCHGHNSSHGLLRTVEGWPFDVFWTEKSENPEKSTFAMEGYGMIWGKISRVSMGIPKFQDLWWPPLATSQQHTRIRLLRDTSTA